MIQGAIFDMDGTLLDSMPAWETVGGELVQAQGIVPPSDFSQILHALSLEDTPAYLQTLGVALSMPEFKAATIALMREKYLTTVPLKPHCEEFLQQLHRQGVRCCVATATYSGLAAEVLEKLGILQYFQFVVSCDEAGSGKNDPAIFELALSRLGTPKEHTLVFEDALHAAQTAKTAGFRVVVLADDMAKEEAHRLRQVADYYCDSFADCPIDEL